MEVNCTSYIPTTHMLAKELLSRPDSFLIATFENKEGIVEDIKRVFSDGNYDDKSMYISLNIKECNCGNIKR